MFVNVNKICGTTPCMVRGSDDVFRAVEDHLGIGKGETTTDGLFTCVEVECLAACANAPMMQVNNEYVYEDLNYENTKQLLDNLVCDFENIDTLSHVIQRGVYYVQHKSTSCIIINYPT